MTVENKKSLIKLAISLLVIVALVVVAYFIMRAFGVTELSREQIQAYIESVGIIAPIVYIAITFAQVTLVPIPGAVTILAGSYLFGFWLAFFYSYIGMMIGSIVSFALGRAIGRPYINWVAGGKQKADGWLNKLHGRENVFMFFAFLLPIFPDDILCAVAGALSVKWLTFILMQAFTRITSIICTLIFMSGTVIPFEGWGLIVLGVAAAVGITAFVLSLIYADKINQIFSNFINKLSRKNKSEE